MRFPIIIRSRSTEDYRRRYTDARVECAERIVKEQAVIIGQNCQVQESQQEHIKTLQRNLEQADRNTHHFAEQLELQRKVNEFERKNYAGDLQLAHTRYDEFVRDIMDKLLTRAASPAARSSSPGKPADELPPEIQSAIEEFSFGNSIIEQQLTAEAWRRINRNEKHEEIAEKIRAGETPE